MVTAAMATSDVGGDESRAPAFKKIETELSRARSIFPWVEGITNFGDMREDISRVARLLVRTGMAPDEAVRHAGEEAYAKDNPAAVGSVEFTPDAPGAIQEAFGATFDIPPASGAARGAAPLYRARPQYSDGIVGDH
jgi:hypothetical protein